MAPSSNATYTNPANLTGTEFSITLATKTHLAITFHVDTKMAKMFRGFQLELDKETNKMNMYTPNPYLRYKRQANYYARLGHYLTAAWDLDKMQFRLIAPGEKTGPGMGLLRKILKTYWFVMYNDASLFRPSMLFASVNAELAESLMHTIDKFIGNGTDSSINQDDGLLSERSASP